MAAGDGARSRDGGNTFSIHADHVVVAETGSTVSVLHPTGLFLCTHIYC